LTFVPTVFEILFLQCSVFFPFDRTDWELRIPAQVRFIFPVRFTRLLGFVLPYSFDLQSQSLITVTSRQRRDCCREIIIIKELLTDTFSLMQFLVGLSLQITLFPCFTFIPDCTIVRYTCYTQFQVYLKQGLVYFCVNAAEKRTVGVIQTRSTP